MWQRVKKNILDKRNMPFLILGAAFFLLHLTMPHINDDLAIEEGMEFTSLSIKYIYYIVVSKYQDWSSRVIINAVTLVMGKLPHIVWLILDTGMVVLAAVSLAKIAGTLHSKRSNTFLVCLMMLYPFSHMSTAGWKATTVTYLWSLALGLFALIPVGKWMRKEEIRWQEGILYALAVLYGANQEQMAAILTAVYGIIVIYSFMKRRVSICLCIQLLLSAAGFLSALISPGNGQRVAEETVDWFVDYGRLTLLQKLEMGISSAGYQLFYRGNWCFLAMAVLLAALVFRKYQERLYRIIAVLPLAVTLVTGVFSGILQEWIPGLMQWKQALTVYGTVTVENYTRISAYLPLAGICVLLGTVVISIYLVYGNTVQTVLVAGIFLSGYASRVVLAFSPTVWASSWRTYLYLYMSIIAVALLLYKSWIQGEGEKEQAWSFYAENACKVLASVIFICGFMA